MTGCPANAHDGVIVEGSNRNFGFALGPVVWLTTGLCCLFATHRLARLGAPGPKLCPSPGRACQPDEDPLARRGRVAVG